MYTCVCVFVCVRVHACVHACMHACVTRFAERVLYTHSFKTHFSLPFDN